MKADETKAKLIGRRLRGLRHEQGVGVQELVKKLGIEKPTWYHYEAGRSAFPHTAFEEVAEALGVSPRELFTRLYPSSRREGSDRFSLGLGRPWISGPVATFA